MAGVCELGKRLTAVQSWISRGLREAFLAAVLWVKRPPLHLQLSVVGGLADGHHQGACGLCRIMASVLLN